MPRQRFFLDTAFVQALLNQRDRHHRRALDIWPGVRSAEEIFTTEAVLVEIGNALSSRLRLPAAKLIRLFRETSNVTIVGVSSDLFYRALDLYESRPDKTWGMTDCISFVVMSDEGLVDALTADHHFVQAGFRAVMLDPARR